MKSGTMNSGGVRENVDGSHDITLLKVHKLLNNKNITVH